MWRDVVRSLSVDAVTYEPILDALSINTTVCEYIELVIVLGSALLRKCGGDVAYLVSGIKLLFLYDIHRRGSCLALVWRGKRVSPHRFVTGTFPWPALVNVARGGDLQAGIA